MGSLHILGLWMRGSVRAANPWRWLVLLLFASWSTGCASLPPPRERPVTSAWATPEQTALGQLTQARRAQAKARPESGFFLLDSVELAFSSRLALVDRAQKALDLQYYAIHADASTEVLLDRVRAAARRGVRVRILLDDFNTVGEDAQVLRLAFEPGIEVRLFNPVPGPRGSLVGRVLGSLHDIERLQKRMHNKLFIADSAWGITGGRNLGDAYFGGGEKSTFVDLDVLAAGSVVRQMSASFDRYWNDPLAYPVQELLSRDDLDKLRERRESQEAARQGVRPASDPPAGPIRTAAAAGHDEAKRPVPVPPSLDLATVPLIWASSTLLVDKPGKVGPGDDEAEAGETLVDGLLQLMRDARREVLIVSPYFVPGEPMMQVFADLRRRGVAVRVLTNSLASTDAPAAHAGYRRYREKLLALGVELYEMRADAESAGVAGSSSRGGGGSGVGLGSTVGGSKSGASRASLHSKAVVLDRRLAVIGSMNLDLRSQLKNSEVALLIRSRAMSEAAAATIEGTFARGAYRVEKTEGGLLWRAPPGAGFADATSEPDAGFKLKFLVNVLAPFAPDEML